MLATDDGHSAGYSPTTPALLEEQLDRAAALASRPRICAVVTQEQRRRLESSPLWFLPESNVFAHPEKVGTAHGILLALLRISERDPEARVVLLPSTQHTHDEGSFLELVERVPDARADPVVAAGSLERLTLPYLDFRRDVLPGEKRRRGQWILPLTAPVTKQ
jgi:hypothetical protein